MVRNSREEWKTYKNVFDKHSERLLFKLSSQGHFEELKEPIALGKEANIFTAETKENRVIVKIYRLENCNFNKMYQYIRTDPRYINLKSQRRKIVFAWTQREYRNLLKARDVIRVPTPITFKDNILIMELIGEPALQLKDKHPKNPEEFLKKIIENIRKLHKHGLIHGDLSEFNILNHNEEPIFIDFSQATMTETPNSEELLERDLKNIERFFTKIGVEKELIKTLKKELPT